VSYRKAAHTKLHHVETIPNDDGTYTVEAHLVHRPPMPDGKKMQHMAAPSQDYPNKVVRLGADTQEEAAEKHLEVVNAHKHEKVRRMNEDAEEVGESPKHEMVN
jgi:hypothetical protein